MASVNQEKRAELIGLVQKLGKVWDVMAQTTAIDFARNPEDKKLAAEAKRYVSMADAVDKTAREACDLINGYWPKDEVKS